MGNRNLHILAVMTFTRFWEQNRRNSAGEVRADTMAYGVSRPICPVSSAGRAYALQAWGYRFESCYQHLRVSGTDLPCRAHNPCDTRLRLLDPLLQGSIAASTAGSYPANAGSNPVLGIENLYNKGEIIMKRKQLCKRLSKL